MAKTGSITYQVNATFKEINAFGESKHEAKENYKDRTDVRQIDKFMHGFGKESGIFSVQTYKDYLAVSIQAAKHAQEKFGIRDVSKIEAAHIKSFLSKKTDSGASKATIQKYSAALEKFESALSRKYGEKYDFGIKTAISDRVKSKLTVKERAGYSAYAKPIELVKYIQKMNVGQEFKLAVRLQLESGVRGMKDINHVRIIDGKVVIKTDNSGKGATKGGKVRELQLSNGLKNDLKSYLYKNDLASFKVNYKGYLSVLKQAAAATGQKYEATHGLRHGYYDNRAYELQKQGLNVQNSWKQVSNEIGHNRIVHNYTR